MKILIATMNKGKIKEFQKIIPENKGVEILRLTDLSIKNDVEETGNSFADNAFIKASYYQNISNTPTVSEDSGLEIEALDGEPGVYSARYGGTKLTDDERVDLVLKKLRNVPKIKRKAKFISVICGIGFKPEPIFCTGVLNGFISEKKEGKNGFGYDPIFLPERKKITTASMTIEQKNNISHRKKSIDKFLKVLITDKII